MDDHLDATRRFLAIRCADALELMTDHLEGNLSDGDAARTRAHLAGCEPCRVFLDQLRATIEIVHGAAPTERFSVDSARLGSLVDLYRSQQRERGWRPAATFVSVPALTRR